jgi:tetratricopeptide (TPR) repeat protein
MEEAHCKVSLGNMYKEFGEIDKAIEYYEQALTLYKEIGARGGESNVLANLGNCYLDKNNTNKALDYYYLALDIKREIGERLNEAIIVSNIAEAYFNLEKYTEAKEKSNLAIQIADEVSYPPIQSSARLRLSAVHLVQNDLVNALAISETTLKYDVPERNHEVSTLNGIIYLRQGDKIAARQAFTRATAQSDEILLKTPEFYSALDAKGLALCGLVLCDDKGHLADAIECFRKARKIARHEGVIKTVLRLFEELAKCDSNDYLTEVRNAIIGD